MLIVADDSDRCEPFDYLVSYDPQTVSSVHNSFIEEIERNENLDENGERAHGRPTIIHYPKYELDKLFKRAV